jgi:hypothetical protein
MGTEDDDAQGQEYEKPIHGVIISKPFRMAKYPVTQSLWEFFMGYNSSHFKGDARPVENVTWNEVQEFIVRLNSHGVRKYRLPTEAEWEYSARAGRDWPYYFGPNADELPQYAWFGNNSGNRTQNVGLKDPNRWGLYDMLGNVWEWVSDWYGDYSSSSSTNPNGPIEGSSKVIRGGAWGSSPWLCRVTTRSVKGPDERSPLIGFRLALDGIAMDEIPRYEEDPNQTDFKKIDKILADAEELLAEHKRLKFNNNDANDDDIDDDNDKDDNDLVEFYDDEDEDDADDDDSLYEEDDEDDDDDEDDEDDEDNGGFAVEDFAPKKDDDYIDVEEDEDPKDEDDS